MFLDYIDVIKKYDNVVIFGAGKIGNTIFSLLRRLNGEQRIAFCDNSFYVQGNYFDYNVYSVEEAVKKYPNALYILAGQNNTNEMKNQLLERGIKRNNIIDGSQSDIIEEMKLRYNYVDNRDRTKPLTKIRFEIDCVEHCNLNCVGCSVFAPLSEPNFINVETLEKDLKRLSVIFRHECEYIYLIGGEPLMHPNLEGIIKLSRKYFPIGKIFVFTNGTLVMRQNKQLWETCRKNGVSVILTKYPIMIDYKQIIGMLDDEGIDWEWAFSNDCVKYMESSNLDLDGKQDIRDSFKHCSEGNNCIKLRDGRLYTCNVVPSIYKFNDAFNKDLVVTEEDYIDIYEDITAEEVLDRLAHPIPFCRYCAKAIPSERFKWRISEKKIEEWII